MCKPRCSPCAACADKCAIDKLSMTIPLWSIESFQIVMVCFATVHCGSIEGFLSNAMLDRQTGLYLRGPTSQAGLLVCFYYD